MSAYNNKKRECKLLICCMVFVYRINGIIKQTCWSVYHFNPNNMGCHRGAQLGDFYFRLPFGWTATLKRNNDLGQENFPKRKLLFKETKC